MCLLEYERQKPINNCVLSVCAITWQRGGRGLAAGGPEELDVRGMEPASLPLLPSSLEGKERVNQSPAASPLDYLSRLELMNLFGRAEF